MFSTRTAEPKPLSLRWIWQHPSNRRRKVRRVAQVLRFKAENRLKGRRRLTRIGSRSVMWVDSRYASSYKVLCANPPDHNSMMAWRRALESGDLFVDIGANVGSYTLWVAEEGVDVLAVEPDPETCRRLRENVALNRYPVKVLQVAIGSDAGFVDFTAGLDSENHLVTNGERGRATRVRASTLDALIGDRVVGGVKVDVEGAELLVLQGAQRALAEQRIKHLQLEWNDASLSLLGQDRRPTARLLEAHGYSLFRPDDDGVLRPIDTWDFGPDVFAKPTVDDGRARGI